MIKYTFNDGPVTFKNASKADPQKIGEALAKIQEAAAGELKPEDVLEAARNNRHVLHKHFEWDDKVAADAFRIDQARHIIRVVRVVETGSNDNPPRAFISVATDKGTSYRSASEVKSSSDLQTALLKQAHRELEAFLKRFHDLVDVCVLVDAAKAKLEARIGEMGNRDAA